MRDFMIRGGAISVDHLAELHQAADNLASGGSAVQAHAGSSTAATMACAKDAEPVGGDLEGVSQGSSGGMVSAALGPISEREGLEVLSAHDFHPPGPYYAMVPLDGRMREINLPLEACLSVVSHAHAMLWDQAVVLAAEEGPMPLVGAEAWVEGDEAYRARLIAAGSVAASWNAGLELDIIGENWCGLPRARLVPVES